MEVEISPDPDWRFQLLDQLPPQQFRLLVEDIRERGVLVPIEIDENGQILDGHHRYTACMEVGIDPKTIPRIVRTGLTELEKRSHARSLNAMRRQLTRKQRRRLIEQELIDNPAQSNNSIAKRLGVSDVTVAKVRTMLGLDGVDRIGQDGKVYELRKRALLDRFVVPPFSVLDARSGYWRERKNRWLSLGIRSEVGRGTRMKGTYTLGWDELGEVQYVPRSHRLEKINGTTQIKPEMISIFDPVLCEITYRWWAPEGALVLDPFAGGSVRGVVAASLGHHYVGVDLSEIQVKANVENALEVGIDPIPEWHVGDSREIVALAGDRAPYDLLFTCPPYANLERYSDDPKDISTLRYPQFLDAYREILHASAGLLADNRFAVVVVGEVRNSHGNYVGLVNDTTDIMREAGLHLYNDAILLSPVGTQPQRASRSFAPGRKLSRGHQNVMVYVKGDGKAAATACAAIGDEEIE